MYSVVVLMALSGSVDVPDIGRRGGGGCCGCHGGGGRRGRHGCHGGCYGGCYGGGYGGCYGGGYGGCYGGGWGGCYGGGYGGGFGGCYGGTVMPYVPAKPMPGPGPVKPGDGKKTGLDDAAPATIVVTLPAEAKLKIDDYVARSTSTERTFVSPPLQVGKEFHYTLKVEHQGKERSQTVTVRAGEVTRVNLSPTGSTVAAR